MSAFEDISDQADAAGVELSENVAEDFVEYFRSRVVGHEEEGWLMYLSMLTGWTADENCHNNVLGLGAPGSGKSLTKNVVSDLVYDRDKYTKTSASANAILDSVEWDLSLVAPMDEYDKIDRPIIEVLKSSNPEDGGYSKDRNVEDTDAKGGYSPEEVSAEANPWVLLYAPSSKKGGVDDELEDRALVLYFSNDKHTRRGIGRKEFGHEKIDSSEYDDEYIYDAHALSARLREHVHGLPVESYYEEDDGERHLAGRSGGTHIYQPKWVWYVCEPIFNLDDDATNRVYGIVDNLIRASALLNEDERERTTIEVYVDEDSTETEEREAVVVGPQDVANVLSCLPTLLSTTHQLTPLKRHILDAVDATEPSTDADGTTVSKVQAWLDDNDIPHPSRTTLKDRMDELSEDYYLQAWDSSAGPKGQATAYERHEDGALQVPNIHNLQQYANRDGIELPHDDCVDIDPEEPFDGVSDPVRDQSFEDTVRAFREQFQGEDVNTDAADFMGPDDSGGDTASTESQSDGSNTDSAGGQASLGDVSSDGVEATGDGSDVPDLDPDGQPSDPTEQWVFEAMQEQDGNVFAPKHGAAHYVGACPHDKSPSQVDMSGTVLDPNHELWQDRPDYRDDRVMSESDALREINDAYKELRQKGLVVEDDDAGPPKTHVIRVADLEDVR